MFLFVYQFLIFICVFVYLFAGVIGPSQDLDFLIHVASKIKTDYTEICFLIVGEGIEKKKTDA